MHKGSFPTRGHASSVVLLPCGPGQDVNGRKIQRLFASRSVLPACLSPPYAHHPALRSALATPQVICIKILTNSFPLPHLHTAHTEARSHPLPSQGASRRRASPTLRGPMTTTRPTAGRFLSSVTEELSQKRQQPRKTTGPGPRPQPTARGIFQEVNAQVGWSPQMLASPYSELVRYERVDVHDVAAAGDGRAAWVDVVGSNEKAVRRNVGLLRFLGAVYFADGTWAGIELQNALVTGNLNEGSIDEVQYFTCSAGHQGLFVNAKWVRKSFLQKSPSLVKLGGRSTPRPRSSLPVLPQQHCLPSPHDHISPRAYNALEDFLQLDASTVSSEALDTAAGIVHDLTYVTTRTDKWKREKQIREQRGEETRTRLVREREAERKRSLELVAEKARQALRASTPRLPAAVIKNKYNTYDNDGRRMLSLSSPSPMSTSRGATPTAVARMRGSTPTSSFSTSGAATASRSPLPSLIPLHEEEHRPSSSPSLSSLIFSRSSMDIKLPILTSWRQEGTVQCHRPQTRVLSEDYVPPAFRAVVLVPIAAVVPSTTMPTLHAPKKDSNMVTATATDSRKVEERVWQMQPWQAEDGEDVDLVHESFKLLGKINGKQEKLCYSAFQGAQDYLEGMAAAEGVR